MKIENIENFPKNIIAGVTLRNLEDYPPIGFSISRSDKLKQNQIDKNREVLAEKLNIDRKKMKFQKQIHSDIIRIVDENSDIEESDGMITDHKGIMLNISIADCCAILMYDIENEVIAGIHSGWRGTAENISGKAIKLLKNQFNSQPENIICYMSACASGERYEVGEDVAQYFPSSITQISDQKFLFDNKNEISLQLKSEGIIDENLYISNVCTIENENYHSYRRDRENSGRMSAFIGMKV